MQHLPLARVCAPLVLLVATLSGRASAQPSVRAAMESRPIDRERLADANRLIDEAVGWGEIPGAVLLVGRGEEIVYEKAYGSRALKPGRAAMTTDTIFALAWLSKPVGCATSVMLL